MINSKKLGKMEGQTLKLIRVSSISTTIGQNGQSLDIKRSCLCKKDYSKRTEI